MVNVMNTLLAMVGCKMAYDRVNPFSVYGQVAPKGNKKSLKSANSASAKSFVDAVR